VSASSPIALYVKEDRTFIRVLQLEPCTENNSGILQSHLIKMRRDGVAKHAAA